MTEPEPDGANRALVDVAVRAAELGAGIVATAATRPRADGELKGAGDYVTAVDRDSEDAIRRFLSEATRDIPVLAEEGGGDHGDTYWAVDPLDGTTNFLLGFPAVAVSVALVSAGVVTVGAIEAPLLGQSFAAARGSGAWSGTERLRVSARPPERAVVATGFPFRDRSLMTRYRPAFDRIWHETEDLRRPGAAALDLAWTAAGVFDGYFELNMSIWDVAAGTLMVEEAGGVVTDWDGSAAYLGGDVLAASPQTHRVLLAAAAERHEPGRRTDLVG